MSRCHFGLFSSPPDVGLAPRAGRAFPGGCLGIGEASGKGLESPYPFVLMCCRLVAAAAASADTSAPVRRPRGTKPPSLTSISLPKDGTNQASPHYQLNRCFALPTQTICLLCAYSPRATDLRCPSQTTGCVATPKGPHAITTALRRRLPGWTSQRSRRRGKDAEEADDSQRIQYQPYCRRVRENRSTLECQPVGISAPGLCSG